ncbi:MAG: hypothetical protein IPK82_43280 [Polyangiaceae bacterium]|nr:hypothetical protein [Polyangiaceae bacterium]
MRIGVWLGLGLLAGLYASLGCAANNNTTSTGTGGNGGSGASTGQGAGGTGAVINAGGTGQGGFEGCAKFTAEAAQAPAAILFAVDMSASMKKSQKWSTAQTSIVGAMDKDVFDHMTLGLVTFPTDFTDPPQCVCDYVEGQLGPGTCSLAVPNGVSCGFSGLPQVPMAPAGTDKSNAGTGVRSSIYNYLVSHNPLSNDDDGSPVYDAMVSGYNALKNQNIARRVLILITDGGFSCTSLTTREGYVDGYGCNDWEYPDAVNQLITESRDDMAKPIFTFVIGVPGSDSVGIKKDGFDTPPYHMKLALSTYAVNGSPDTVDPACSKDIPFTKDGADPPIPCHFDLSSASFNPDILAGAIQTIKGKALGCVYDLPTPPNGEIIDDKLVNVEVTVDGNTAVIPRRKDPNDACAADGCWDYNAAKQVQVLGKTCEDITKAVSAKVDIKVGCETVVK